MLDRHLTVGKTRTTRLGWAATVAVSLACCLLTASCAQGVGGTSGSGAWQPARDVTIVVPFSPGGGSDVFGRALAKGVEQVDPDVNVSVVNKPAGSGAVGYGYFYSKQADPYYLLPSETSGVVLPLTIDDTPWTWRDFTPVMQIGEDVTMMLVQPDSPHQKLTDVVDAVKQGDQLRVGVTGATGMDAIVTSLLEDDQGIKFERRVVFDSGGEMVTALLGGDIDLAMLNPSEVIGQVKAGKVRPLTVFADERYKGEPLSDVPTAKEDGIDVSFTQYRGVFAPGGLSDEEAAYWTDTVRKWTKSDAYRTYIEDNFLKPVQRGPDEFVTYLKEYEQQVKTTVGR